MGKKRDMSILGRLEPLLNTGNLCRYLYAASIHDDVFEHTLNFNSPKSSIWTQVHFDPEYSSYCVASLSPVESGWLALGNLHGYIKLMKLAATGQRCVVL